MIPKHFDKIDKNMWFYKDIVKIRLVQHFRSSYTQRERANIH